MPGSSWKYQYAELKNKVLLNLCSHVTLKEYFGTMYIDKMVLCWTQLKCSHIETFGKREYNPATPTEGSGSHLAMWCTAEERQRKRSAIEGALGWPTALSEQRAKSQSAQVFCWYHSSRQVRDAADSLGRETLQAWHVRKNRTLVYHAQRPSN